MMENFESSGFSVETEDFSVIMFGFAGSPSASDAYIQSQDNVYDIISSNAITNVNFYSNFSGITVWDLGNHSIPEVLDPQVLGVSTLFGQYYLIIDGLVRVLRGREIDIYGINIGLTQGDHTITLLYVSYTQDLSPKFASDTVVIRIRENDNFEKYNSYSIPVSLDHKDLFEDSRDIVRTEKNSIIITNQTDTRTQYGYSREIRWEPTIVTDLQYQGSSIEPDQSLIIDEDDAGMFKLVSEVNSTGFTELQVYNEWNKSKGISFLVDGSGIRYMDETFESSTISDVTVRDGNNFIGILTLAPYGIWHKAVNLPDWIDCATFSCLPNKVDHEFGIGIWYPATIFNASSGEYVELSGSFDFTASIQGVSLNLLQAIPMTNITTTEDATASYFIYPLTLMVFARRRWN